MQNSRVKPKKSGSNQMGEGKNAWLRLEKLGREGKSKFKAA